jgi:hypothetical protein
VSFDDEGDLDLDRERVALASGAVVSLRPMTADRAGALEVGLRLLDLLKADFEEVLLEVPETSGKVGRLLNAIGAATASS